MFLEATLVISLLILLWLVLTYRGWKKRLLKSLGNGSQIANTSIGEIEYSMKGNGPVLLMLHGSPGGYDQSLLDFERWTKEGFSLLAISRSGYLRTPLSSGRTFQQQADAIIALLDELNISKVSVLAASGGGPTALHLAKRYPDRIRALVLMAAVCKQYTVKEEQKNSILARIILSDSIADIGVWFYDVLTRYWTSRSLREMFKENTLLESDELDLLVKEVMSNAEQVDWYKRFIRTTCPMSLRIPGLKNDLFHLEKVSFDNLENVTCPALVIHGTADGDVSFDNAEFSSSSIPNSRLYKLENIGHILWLGNHVEDMYSEISKFLKDVE